MIAFGSDLFAGSYERGSGVDGGLFRTTDNGNTCTRAQAGLTDTNVVCFAGSGTHLLAGTSTPFNGRHGVISVCVLADFLQLRQPSTR